MVYGDLEILSDIHTALELTRVLIGCLEQLIDEPHPFFPILLGGIGFIELLEFRIVSDKVFLGYRFMKNRLLKFIIFYLYP